VAPATRLQIRYRGVAAITACLVFACGLLAMRHEASTPHTRDRAGGFVHAHALTGHHTDQTSDVHGQRNPDADGGECAVLTASHQAASAAIAPPAVAAQVVALRAPAAQRTTTFIAETRVYRLAPKTSPPVV